MAGLGYLDGTLTEALWVLRGKLCASGPGTARGEQGWVGGAFAPLPHVWTVHKGSGGRIVRRQSREERGH